jgi:putative membrane protein
MTTPHGTPDPDSRARTHLANERTFLAWFRTAIALIALGIAADQFLTRDLVPGVPLVRALATLLVASGILLVVIGAWRYATGRDRIDASDFRPARMSILVTTAAAVLTGVIAIAFVWLLAPR